MAVFTYGAALQLVWVSNGSILLTNLIPKFFWIIQTNNKKRKNGGGNKERMNWKEIN